MSYPAPPQNLLSLTLQMIDSSQEVIFAISQISSNGQTAIALMFDKVPKICVEFGPELGKVSNPNAIGNGIKLNHFSEEIMSIIYPIRSFEILTLSQKNHARQLFSNILDIQMGMYNILQNTCHDHVIKSYDVIAAYEKECLSPDDKEIKQRLTEILKPTKASKLVPNSNPTLVNRQSPEVETAQLIDVGSDCPPSQRPGLLSTVGAVAAVPVIATGEVVKVAGSVAKTSVQATANIATGTVNLAAGAVGTAAQGTAHLATGAVGLAAHTVGTVADVGVGLVTGTAHMIGNVFKKL